LERTFGIDLLMNEGRVERRLAAILAADVVGYSRLMGQDEAGTLARLRTHRRELIDPKIAEHKGRIVKTTGDGILVEFPSVVEAVACAVAVQRRMTERETSSSEDQCIRYRIGINLGDIIVEDGDIFGDGVNVAARLEALAEPGGICISRTVRNQIRDKLPYEFEDMGEQQVKNIARPVRADALSAAAVAAIPLVPVKTDVSLRGPPSVIRPSRWHIAAAGLGVIALIGIAAWWVRGSPIFPPEHTVTKPAWRLSIVVLPFANLSGDPEQEYFADSITDDLTTDLSLIADSFVIARTTAFTYKGKPVDIKQIGHDLGVRYALEGSVRRLDDKVEINVQLIDTDSDAHVWADRFDSDLTSLARAQRDITARLANTLHLELLEAVSHRIDEDDSVNLDARDFVMRGSAWFNRGISPDNLDKAEQAFQQALSLDPKSAPAKVGIARVMTENISLGRSHSREQDLIKIEQLLLSALEQDRNDSMVHAAIGRLRRFQNKFAESQLEFERAVALDNNNAYAILQLGFALVINGQPEPAIPHFEKSIALNPRTPGLHYNIHGLGDANLFAGRVDDAIRYYRQANEINSHYYLIPLHLAGALGLKGEIEEAKAMLAQVAKLRSDVRTLADFHRLHPPYANPKYAAMAADTLDAGLRRAGMLDE
jgi:adenylate cyclase